MPRKTSRDMQSEKLLNLKEEIEKADPEAIEQELRAEYTNGIQRGIVEFSDESETLSPFTTTVKGPAKAAVEKIHQNRSERAQDVDEQQNAPITTDEEKWIENKNRYDYPSVDTIPRNRIAARSEHAAQVAQSQGATNTVEQKGSAKNLQGKFSPKGSKTYGKEENVVRVQGTAEEPERTLAHELGHAFDFGFSDGRGYNLTDELFGLDSPADEGQTKELTEEAKEISQKARGDFRGQHQYRRQYKELTADVVGQAIIQPRATKRDAPNLFDRIQDAAEKGGFDEAIPEPLSEEPERQGLIDL